MAVIVAGSINIDIVAKVDRHPRPGETVAGTQLEYFPGGKGANQAVAAAKAGSEVVMLGAIGTDAFGSGLKEFLEQSGVNVSKVVERLGAPSGTALILVDSAGENTIAVIPGANATVDEQVVGQVDLRKQDILVAQFETPVPSTIEFFRNGSNKGATCILNPAPAASVPPELLSLVDVLILNESELGTLTGLELSESSSEESVGEALAALNGLGLDGSAVVTLGPRGSLTRVGDRVIRTVGHSVNAVDTTGAGDCFVGSLAAELDRGATLDDALTYANAAAALCVQTAGAGPSMPERSAVKAYMSEAFAS